MSQDGQPGGGAAAGPSRRELLAGLAGLGIGAAAVGTGVVLADRSANPSGAASASGSPGPSATRGTGRAVAWPPRVPASGPVILRPATVITMDPRAPRAEAVGVANGRIAVVGSLAQCQARLPAAEVVDLGGSALLPGFVEPHGHPMQSGMVCQAPAYYVAPWLVADWDGVVEVARKAVAEVPAGNSIILFGLDQLLQQCEFPDAAVMDQLFGERLATIIALSQHKAAVTTATLRKLGWVDNPPKDPPGGTYERNADGSLTGIASEVPAVIKLIQPVRDALGGNPIAQGGAFLAGMARAGVTTSTDMGYVNALQPVYEALCANPAMPIRMVVYQATNDPGYTKALVTKAPKEMLSKGGIKFWADGSPWLGTIATSFPYLDTEAVRRAGITDLHPGKNALNYNRDELDAMLSESAASGWQIACHANGDLTLDLVLGCYEDALKDHGLLGTDHRWRLEHVGAVRADQLKRMSELGVVPTFGIFQMMQWGDLLDGQLYESKYGARWSPVGDAAAADFEHLHQSYHNDGNISPQSPLASAQAAITRRSNWRTPDGEYELAAGNLHGPEQQVSLDLALKAITINAAYILARDDQVGSIEVGKFADFTQLAADPYTVNPARLATEAAVVGTWLAGRPTDPDRFAASLVASPPAASDSATALGITGFNCNHSHATTV